jgi:DNA-binding NarL/FixJ family response regulator
VSLAAPEATLVVDDMAASLDWMARAALQAFPDTRVLCATTLAEARSMLREAPQPGVALVDLDLPDGSGVSLIEQLARSPRRTLIIVTTVFADDQHLFPALRAGAAGYLLKDDDIDSLAQRLLAALRGEAALSAPIAQRLVGWFHEPERVPPVPLSPRERELLRLLTKGLTIAQAAAVLQISASTAASYAKSLYRKLDVTNRAEATLEATRRGLIKL